MWGCKACDGSRRSYDLALEGGVSTIFYVLKQIKSELFGLCMLIHNGYQQETSRRSAPPSYRGALLIEVVPLGHELSLLIEHVKLFILYLLCTMYIKHDLVFLYYI